MNNSLRTCGQRRSPRSTLIVLALAAAISSLPSGLGVAVPGSGIATSHQADAGHPIGTMLRPRNVRPRPNFVPYCGSHSPNSRRCIRLELAAIRHARAVQGFPVRRMVLPRNYRRLTYARQIFVLANLERVDRRLQPFRGLTAALNRQARRGAANFDDPIINDQVMRRLGLRGWNSVWAKDLGPLAADYDWMYDDGYTVYGPKITDCNSPHGSGCWGHREAILAHYDSGSLFAGAGAAYPYALSTALVMGTSPGRSLHRTFTWRSAVSAGANARVRPGLRDRSDRVA